jgi:hypothetical protein
MTGKSPRSAGSCSRPVPSCRLRSCTPGTRARARTGPGGSSDCGPTGIWDHPARRCQRGGPDAGTASGCRSHTRNQMCPGIPVLPLPGRKPHVAVRPDACRVRPTRGERAVAANQEPPPDPRADLVDPDMKQIELRDGLSGHGPGQRTRSRHRSSPPVCPGLPSSWRRDDDRWRDPGPSDPSKLF